MSRGAVPNASDGYGLSTDDDADVGGGITAFELNTEVLVPDATGPSVQSAIDDAAAGDVIQTYGDLTLSLALEVDKRLHWIHHGDIEVGAGAGDGIRLGHSAQFQNFSIAIHGNVRGQVPPMARVRSPSGLRIQDSSTVAGLVRSRPDCASRRGEAGLVHWTTPFSLTGSIRSPPGSNSLRTGTSSRGR